MALPVNFDADSAARIYRAVREVERGNRDQKPLSFPSVTEQAQKRIRLATFTGAWAINTSRVVSFYGATSTAQTAAATNLFIDVPAGNTSTPSTTACAILKERGTWFLLQVQHNVHDVLTGVSLEPTRLEFTRQRVAYVGGTAATTGITITECDNEAASAEQLNFFFG